MNNVEVDQWFDENGYDVGSVSFYSDINGDCDDTHFGSCDISGERGSIATCIVAHKDGSGIDEYPFIDAAKEHFNG